MELEADIFCFISFFLVFMGLRVANSDHMPPLSPLGRVTIICIRVGVGQRRMATVTFHQQEPGGPVECNLSWGHLARQQLGTSNRKG